MVAYYGMSEAVGTPQLLRFDGPERHGADQAPIPRADRSAARRRGPPHDRRSLCLGGRVLREHADGAAHAGRAPARTRGGLHRGRGADFRPPPQSDILREEREAAARPDACEKRDGEAANGAVPWRPCGLRGRRDRGFGVLRSRPKRTPRRSPAMCPMRTELRSSGMNPNPAARPALRRRTRPKRVRRRSGRPRNTRRLQTPHENSGR